jgi:DNA polymerase I
MTKLLIDTDYIVYKCCASCEDEIDWGDDVIMVVSKFTEAYRCVVTELTKLKHTFLWDVPELVLFFSDSENFRKTIQPAYKGHRNRKKPCGYKRVINQLKNEYEVIVMPQLEADDAMGIYSTANPGNIICSPDKDMRQIPGRLYNMEEEMSVTEEEGKKWHLIQTLAGDQTDGYAGVPGIGIKRAVSLFEAEGYSWKTVVEAFAEKDLDEDVALENARLAKILTNDDYDYANKSPILWTPAADYRVDDGTGSKNEATKGPSE